MTSEYLKKNGILIEEYDLRDGGIYLGTNSYYLYNNDLYCSEYHSNLNRYTGENRTFLIVDNVKRALDQYNDIYFFDLGLSEEGYEKLVECVGK